MYYDIIQKEVVDEHGNITIELEAETTPPVYDDIAPSDMSLENQLKAGINMRIESAKVQDRLASSDRVTASVVQNGNKVLDYVENAEQLTKKQQQQLQQQQQQQQQAQQQQQQQQQQSNN